MMLSKIRLCSTILTSPSPLLKFLPSFAAPQLRQFNQFTDANMTPTSGKNHCSKHPIVNIDKKDPYDSRHEMFKDGHGVELYNLQDGERKMLPAVVARFKRLDWGAWIRLVRL